MNNGKHGGDKMQNDQQDRKPRRMVPCSYCNGTGWVVRDPDIGTDQECFVCDGTREVEADEDEDDEV
jgi:DnaJ-class molecular chaperone